MPDNGRSIDLRKRCFRYALDIIKLCGMLEEGSCMAGKCGPENPLRPVNHRRYSLLMFSAKPLRRLS